MKKGGKTNKKLNSLNKAVKEDKNKKANKVKYKIRNWSEYNQALVNRGSMDIWISEDVLSSWLAEKEHHVGAPKKFSDLAIETILTVRSVFSLNLRSTQGFVASLFRLSGTELAVPHYSVLSKRGEKMNICLKKKDKKKTTLIIDSTGAKLYGEGEWKVRQHGVSKRRKWKKIHIGIDEEGEIRVSEITDNDCHDSEEVKALTDQEKAEIDKLIGDGSYDTRSVYNIGQERKIGEFIIPPQHNAKIWIHGNRLNEPCHPRDENLRMIRAIGRKAWKELSGYHIRSLIENTMFRFKTIFGDRLSSRNDQNQRNEINIKLSILNKMFELGKPDSYPVTS